MKEFQYTITDPEGIHARPAGELVKAAKAFTSSIKIVKKDNEVTIRIEGEDEDAAFMAMEKFMKEIL